MGSASAASMSPAPGGGWVEVDAAPALAREISKWRRRLGGFGFHVVDVESGRTVYGEGEDRLLVPASNTKLVTSAAALDTLGPGYFFETALLIRGELHRGVLYGDLAVVGRGDPNISGRFYGGDDLGPFRPWIAELQRRGVRQVRGDLWLDHGYFASPEIHPDWDPRDFHKPYQAPVAALGFEDNVLVVKAAPGPGPGGSPVVETSPALPLFTVHNDLERTSSPRRHLVRLSRAPAGHEILVDGRIHTGVSQLTLAISVPDPVIFFGSALRQALEEAGIHLAGEVIPVEHLPGLTWDEVAVHRSSLLPTLEITNRESQNLYAESLVKVLGAERCGRGSWDNGLRAMRDFLRQVGLGKDSYRLADGSGLSRSNRMTARQLTELLVFMSRHRWSREFMTSLPYGGQERSSLEDRLTEPEYGENVFAKTGTLTGVSALSGYAKGRSGRLYAFSILCNRCPVWRARRSQDALVRTLVDHG
jgi:D-alanyl-D-alanine carboxypeptidase/D-alanyl-D-alanine-endopeptidase (penicillin-binding protein 4)